MNVLGIVLLFLYDILLPKLPSMDIQNALFVVMVFYTALVLIKEPTLQQMKCGNGITLMDITGLSMFPLFLEQLA